MAKVSSQDQIVIPQAVREQLNLKPGTELAIEVKGGTLIIKRVVSKYPDWRTMRGMVKIGPSLTKALEEERKAEVARDEARAKARSTYDGKIGS
ncbi:MAG TPA: AbrB/MazE/SpoVT family DNA-binding domain-containing protein [Bryobacteraceae bacterium]|nr:AbrB/MazE/SpoVT family DNA-binding domain-containing protein [Bryobacteraceae bacterium]